MALDSLDSVSILRRTDDHPVLQAETCLQCMQAPWPSLQLQRQGRPLASHSSVSNPLRSTGQNARVAPHCRRSFALLTWQTRYLTQVERRLTSLENLFAELLPNVNLDEALSPTSGAPATGSSASLAEPSASSSKAPVSSRKKAPEKTGESISEAVPDEADGFDWQEDVNELADGMASLSVEPKGTGYLGITSHPSLGI